MDNTLKETTKRRPDWDYWLYEDLGDGRYKTTS